MSFTVSMDSEGAGVYRGEGRTLKIALAAMLVDVLERNEPADVAKASDSISVVEDHAHHFRAFLK